MATTDATPTLSNSEATDSDAFSAVRRLAGFEEDERNAVVAQQRAEFGGVKTVTCRRLSSLPMSCGSSKHSPPRPTLTIIDTVAVEVDDVIRFAGASEGAFEFLAQRGQTSAG